MHETTVVQRFTGDLAAEILHIDEIMAAAGRRGSGPHSAGSASYELRNGCPIPEVVHTDGEPTTCGRANWSLTHRWLAAGHQLLPSDEPPTHDRALYSDVAPLDHETVQADILARHQYVVIVSLSLTCTYPLDD